MADERRIDRAEVYAPGEVLIEIDGTRVFDWVRVSFSRAEPHNSQAAPSADGSHLWVHNESAWGTCELELTQDSPSLGFMRSLASRQEPFGVAAKDKSGTPDYVSLIDALLMDEAPLERAKGETNYRFVLGGIISFGEGGLPA